MTDFNPCSDAASPRPLWAPWRIAYIRGPKAKECFFCVKGDRDCLEDHVVYRSKLAFVLLNDFPYTSGHVLVAPYRHVSTLTDLTAGERQDVLDLLIQAQDVLTKVMQPQGFNVGFNIGEAAGAGVKDHVHGHVVPRWSGDTNFMPVLGGPRVVPESLDDTARLLREAFAAI
ncbi:MAG: HIT domain-containing protein [Lentisphaerae bacterium]|nr:HIT domain-containing protein [Lentisphaerota bacterium]OQC17360.1 MAG: AP-4-A phosphorylase [Lentisphaerae bacterium ADurb.Bin082]HQL86150.1 HIT domain-containing protein [Lentisphaeria bacterium]